MQLPLHAAGHAAPHARRDRALSVGALLPRPPAQRPQYAGSPAAVDSVRPDPHHHLPRPRVLQNPKSVILLISNSLTFTRAPVLHKYNHFVFICFVLGSVSGLTVIPSQCWALLALGSGQAENSDPLTELQCEQHGDVLYGGLVWSLPLLRLSGPGASRILRALTRRWEKRNGSNIPPFADVSLVSRR